MLPGTIYLLCNLSRGPRLAVGLSFYAAIFHWVCSDTLPPPGRPHPSDFFVLNSLKSLLTHSVAAPSPRKTLLRKLSRGPWAMSCPDLRVFLLGLHSAYSDSARRDSRANQYATGILGLTPSSGRAPVKPQAQFRACGFLSLY